MHPFVCIFSLSQRADDVSQWRAYGPRSGGYSIGFRAEGLREIARRQGCVLAPCVYEPEMQRALIAEAVDPVVKALPRPAPTDRARFARSIAPFVRELRSRIPLRSP